MKFSSIFIIGTTLALLFSPLTYAQKASHPSLTPTPAPAPSPGYVNITKLLTVAGPFSKFLDLLQTTKTIDTFQNQANNTEEGQEGLTLFVPKDQAFAAVKNKLSNLTQDQLKSLCLFHGLPHYYSLAEFTQLSQVSPVSTFAGGQYTVNFTDDKGTVHLNSGWTRTKVSSAVYSTDPVAIYQVDKMLLPEAIFGTDIPPLPPAPAPAPDTDITPVADSDTDKGKGGKSAPLSSPSSSSRVAGFGVWSQLVLAVSGLVALLL